MFRPVKDRSALQESEPNWVSGGVEECINKAEELASPTFNREAYAKRHAAWLATKIDCTAFLTYFIESYPGSVEETKKANDAGNSEFWKRFKRFLSVDLRN